LGKIKDIFKSLKPYNRKQAGKSEGISEAEVQSYDFLTASIYGVGEGKKAQYAEYLDMSLYPEVADAIDMIVNEAIQYSVEDGSVVGLKIIDEKLQEENISKNILAEFDYVVNTLFDFDSNADDLFRKFYTEGELFIELTVNPDKPEKGVQGIRILPSYSMTVEYDDNQNPKKYTQNLIDLNLSVKTDDYKKSTKTEIEFQPEQIAYINSGLVDHEKNQVFSYLERAKVPYRQLKWLENAVIIYRIVRAPERRVFYIDVGKMPKNKADQYIQDLIRRYKNKKIYNPATGEVDSGSDVLSMTEDYYFPVHSGTTGSRVDPLPGGQMVGELGDVTYFLRKLYRALKVPFSGSITQSGEDMGGEVTATEINRDEIKFALYVVKIRERFLNILYQVFLTHLNLKGLVEKYNIDKSKVSIFFKEHNAWKEKKNLEFLSQQAEILDAYVNYIGTLLPKEFLYKKIMNLSDDEIETLKEQLEQEAAEAPTEEETPDEFGDTSNIGSPEGGSKSKDMSPPNSGDKEKPEETKEPKKQVIEFPRFDDLDKLQKGGM